MLVSVGTGCIYEIMEGLLCKNREKEKNGIMRHGGLKNATIAHIQSLTNNLENRFEKQRLKKT